MHPRAPHHPLKGGEILVARGVPDAVVYAILSHADHSGTPSVVPFDRSPYARDEPAGFVQPCAVVRPGRSVAGLADASDALRSVAPDIGLTTG